MGILLSQFVLTQKKWLLTSTTGVSWLLCEILWDLWQQKLVIMEVWGKKLFGIDLYFQTGRGCLTPVWTPKEPQWGFILVIHIHIIFILLVDYLTNISHMFNIMLATTRLTHNVDRAILDQWPIFSNLALFWSSLLRDVDLLVAKSSTMFTSRLLTWFFCRLELGMMCTEFNRAFFCWK